MNAREIQRVALITGGAVRVGRAIALGLAEAGYDVAIQYRSSKGPAQEVVSLVEGLGHRCHAVQADLSEPEAAHTVVEATLDAFSRIDLVVNSAAGFDSRRLEDADAASWDAVMALNVRAPHLLVRAAAHSLRENHGSVVNIVDLSAFQPWTEHPVHAVSKAGLAHLTRVQARALAPEIRVNAIAPGAVMPPDGYSEQRRAALAAQTPLRRLGSPEDVVRTVLFLARSDFITGQVIGVDGGRLLGPVGPPGEGG